MAKSVRRTSTPVRRAGRQADAALSQVRRTQAAASTAVREVGHNFAEALEHSVDRRPIATLCLAIGIGFILGARWAR